MIEFLDGKVVSDLPDNAEDAARIVKISGDLDLYATGYAHALPALTSIGGYLDARGYAHADWPWLIAAGADSRGYFFYGMLEKGGWRIKAGCRNFTLCEARSHWTQKGNLECLALVDKIAAEIDAREVAAAA